MKTYKKSPKNICFVALGLLLPFVSPAGQFSNQFVADLRRLANLAIWKPQFSVAFFIFWYRAQKVKEMLEATIGSPGRRKESGPASNEMR